jgi:hypothetical protein
MEELEGDSEQREREQQVGSRRVDDQLEDLKLERNSSPLHASAGCLEYPALRSLDLKAVQLPQ